MTNMKYCQFENTYLDLRRCNEAMWDELSPEEAIFRKRLIELCAEIANDFSEELEDNEE